MRAAQTAPLCGRCLAGFAAFGGLGFASPDTVLQWSKISTVDFCHRFGAAKSYNCELLFAVLFASSVKFYQIRAGY
jgi:hypothetical protein